MSMRHTHLFLWWEEQVSSSVWGLFREPAKIILSINKLSSKSVSFQFKHKKQKQNKKQKTTNKTKTKQNNTTHTHTHPHTPLPVPALKARTQYTHVYSVFVQAFKARTNLCITHSKWGHFFTHLWTCLARTKRGLRPYPLHPYYERVRTVHIVTKRGLKFWPRFVKMSSLWM